jgi:uncharacterized protein (DUF302 family)
MIAMPMSTREDEVSDHVVGADGLIVKTTPLSVEAAAARLSGLIAEKGMKLFALIDHSGAAAAAGLELRDTKVVIFGSPAGGTPVMDAVPLVALDLPLKVLIYDDGGTTRVCYAPPQELARRYGLSAELAAHFAGINALTDALLAT